MINIKELLLRRNLQKIINCYCADCVGRTTLETAPSVITFNDFNANDLTCLCADCICDNFVDWKGTSKCINIYTSYIIHCQCYCGGLGLDYNKKIFKSYKLIETSNVNFKLKIPNRNKHELLFLSGTEYSTYINTKNLNSSINMENWSLSLIRKSTVNDNVWVCDNCKNLSDFYSKKYRLIELLDFTYNETYLEIIGIYTNKYLNYLDKINNLENLYNSGILIKILYYGEYLGYKCIIKDHKYIIYIDNNENITLFNTILEFQNETKNYIINKFGSKSKEIFKLLDTYCKECKKYKGSCLGHEISDKYEYKNI